MYGPAQSDAARFACRPTFLSAEKLRFFGTGGKTVRNIADAPREEYGAADGTGLLGVCHSWVSATFVTASAEQCSRNPSPMLLEGFRQ
jgi:hypothetical protein